MRRRTLGSKKLVDKEIRFTSSTSWTIPAGCKSIDIFLVGGGGAGETWASGSYGAYAVPNETGLHTAYVDVILKNIRNY